MTHGGQDKVKLLASLRKFTKKSTRIPALTNASTEAGALKENYALCQNLAAPYSPQMNARTSHQRVPTGSSNARSPYLLSSLPRALSSCFPSLLPSLRWRGRLLARSLAFSLLLPLLYSPYFETSTAKCDTRGHKGKAPAKGNTLNRMPASKQVVSKAGAFAGGKPDRALMQGEISNSKSNRTESARQRIRLKRCAAE